MKRMEKQNPLAAGPPGVKDLMQEEKKALRTCDRSNMSIGLSETLVFFGCVTSVTSLMLRGSVVPQVSKPA
jgi:hypothetical protein